MQYRTNSMAEGTFYTYLFEKNLQGDIIAVYNTSGTKLVSYVYDAWGNVTVTNHNVSGTNSGARHNPFRYRGYYYDTETGYYYLQSRYYNPEWGRFLNADSTGYLGANGDLISYNLYAYCSNNPVMYSDPTGHLVISSSLLILTMAGLVSISVLGFFMCTESGQNAIQESANSIANTVDDIANSIANTVDDIFDKIKNLNDKHKGEYTVYALADSDGVVRYVGRTKNFERRMAEHRKNSKTEGLTPIMRIDGLSWSEARGLEQLGIVSYNTINLGKNSINGISPKNNNREAYLTAAWNYIYNQATNEWYNLLGK